MKRANMNDCGLFDNKCDIVSVIICLIFSQRLKCDKYSLIVILIVGSTVSVIVIMMVGMNPLPCDQYILT